jgi:hypothetical protein
VSVDKSSERQYRDFEFNLRELVGSMGDFGTLFPLAIGYIAVNGLNPAGLFIMLGLTNIALGLVYCLPMPLQPKKVVAVTAIAQEWSPALIRDYFPEKVVTERKLMLNMGVMNVVASFFGGMPMCHGAGGPAGQYYFGARTGGTPILEGLIEVAIGLLLSTSIASLMAAFPMPLIAGMLLLVGIELARPVIRLRGYKPGLAVATAAVSVVGNMAIGFAAGLAVTHLVRLLQSQCLLPCLCRRRGKEGPDA